MNRRVTLVLGIVVGVFVLLVVVGLLTEKDEGSDGLRALGAPAGTACSSEEDVPATGASDHVGGTVVYDRVPPSSGQHAVNWVTVRQRRYQPDSAPPVEQVVHNLEHGWIVVWYSPTATELADLDRVLDAVDERKVVAMPYVRGALPTPYVLTAWGHERRCTAVSGEAIADFVDAHAGKNGDAPEPEGP